ncbi:MAG: hypothetical protein Q8K79_16970 [Solirubrobacteraceae bacterium]|nr:hypothetical protein [Solirubrobacteraceae bacterium]
MSSETVGPDGIGWRVGRRWLPARVRLRDWDWRESAPDWDGLSFFDDPSGFLLALGVIATAMIVFLVIWPIVAIALELVILALLFLASLAGRVLFRKPWTVFARSAGLGEPRVHEWRVVGWRDSSRLIADVRAALRSGGELPAGAVTTGPPPQALPRVGRGSPQRWT